MTALCLALHMPSFSSPQGGQNCNQNNGILQDCLCTASSMFHSLAYAKECELWGRLWLTQPCMSSPLPWSPKSCSLDGRTKILSTNLAGCYGPTHTTPAEGAPQLTPPLQEVLDVLKGIVPQHIEELGGDRVGQEVEVQDHTGAQQAL